MASAAGPSTTLTGLPVDVLTSILSHLPTQHILECRIVCPHFRDVIYEEDNRAPIYGPAIRRSAQRLLDKATPILNYGEEVPFAIVLEDYLAHRGIQANDFCRWRDINAFARQWRLNREGVPLPWQREHGALSSQTAGVVRYFVMLHIQLHHPELHIKWEGTQVPIDWCGFVRSAGQEALSLLRMNAAAVAKSYWQITHGLFGSAPLLHADPEKGEHLPDWPLTATASNVGVPRDDHPYPEKYGRQGGLCDVQQLQKLLGVDLVGLPAGYNTFAYCVKTRWAYALVKDVMQSGLLESLDWTVGQMEWKVRAAVLEQMYLY